MGWELDSPPCEAARREGRGRLNQPRPGSWPVAGHPRREPVTGIRLGAGAERGAVEILIRRFASGTRVGSGTPLCSRA